MTALATSQFERIADIAMKRWGLNLTDRKKPLVSNRLAKFLYRSPFRVAQRCAPPPEQFDKGAWPCRAAVWLFRRPTERDI